MGKYTGFQRATPPRRQKEPHPIWRGVGCLMMVIVPVLSYVLAAMTVDLLLKSGIGLPPELLGPPSFKIPAFVYRAQGLGKILGWFMSLNNLYANLLITLVYILAFALFISLIYAILYQTMGPPRDPLDAEPFNVKVKKYKR